MVDIRVDCCCGDTTEVHGPFWFDECTVYQFFGRARISYSKSVDKGCTWSCRVRVCDLGCAPSGNFDFGLWWDRWTPGYCQGSTDIIHIMLTHKRAGVSDTGGVVYRQLCLLTDTLSTPVCVQVICNNMGFPARASCVVRTSCGNLYGWTTNGSVSGTFRFLKSTNCGCCWASRAKPCGGRNHNLFIVGNACPNDVVLIGTDENQSSTTMFTWDDSSCTWDCGQTIHCRCNTAVGTWEVSWPIHVPWLSCCCHTFIQAVRDGDKFRVFQITGDSSCFCTTEWTNPVCLAGLNNVTLLAVEGQDDVFAVWQACILDYSVTLNCGCSWSCPAAFSSCIMTHSNLNLGRRMDTSVGGRIKASWVNSRVVYINDLNFCLETPDEDIPILVRLCIDQYIGANFSGGAPIDVCFSMCILEWREKIETKALVIGLGKHENISFTTNLQ